MPSRVMPSRVMSVPEAAVVSPAALAVEPTHANGLPRDAPSTISDAEQVSWSPMTWVMVGGAVLVTEVAAGFIALVL